ncbi:MAG: bifunctional 5,10-methylenetetrahydrofolate dehydrogenase/5,10-methenyltetrahydrofolate cyclohydrolase [Candidatus Thorarchaeota archaeon]|nr:MAG: bifunctional 5,10-methylenetetrahydrofolate dehydrogenase/5,10-methenyltetrahydrofolate cyclohydrolase [Candidatus Thorarchaeota archaeon]
MSEDDFKPICEDHVIKGKRLSNRLRNEVQAEVEQLVKKYGISPKLVTVIVGEDEGSQMYVRMKHKASNAAGILSEHHGLSGNTTQKELLELIQKLNDDSSVHGILVQLPLPKHIDEKTIISAIAPLKDVDGFSPANVYRLFYGGEDLSAATPHGIVTMLDRLGWNDLSGKHAVIINRSTIVGKPLVMLLLNRNATVTVCHSRTKDLSSFTKQADVLVSAIGRRTSADDPFFISEEMVKEGAVVIDVATPFGDVDFEKVKEKATCVTPVPGGVGPMTIAMLLKNVVAAYSAQVS